MGSLRYLTAGESHGEELLGILEGMPAGLQLEAQQDIDPWLVERQRGYGRGRRQQIESDKAIIISGVRFGMSMGSPIGIRIANKDWQNWSDRMSVANSTRRDERPVTIPRPGHADLPGGTKYGHQGDLRNVFERASARETAMRVAIGAIAAKLLNSCGIESVATVESIGEIESQRVTTKELFELRNRISESPVRTHDSTASDKIVAAIDTARVAGDTLGGVVSCHVRGVPVGIGSHVHWDRKLDGRIAAAIMSIQAVKGVEIGAGFRAAQTYGSEIHDPILTKDGDLNRRSNNAGGIEGGISNGEPIIVRAAMKPLSTLMQPLDSVDLVSGLPAAAHIERSDVCAVPSLAIILEAVLCLTLADLLLDTFGGDTVTELQERVELRRVRSSIPTRT